MWIVPLIDSEAVGVLLNLKFMNTEFKKIFDFIHLERKDSTTIENRLDLIDLIIKNKKNIPTDLHKILYLWRKNVEDQLSTRRINKYIVLHKDDILANLIDRSMGWSLTPEGSDFWSNYGPYTNRGHEFKSVKLSKIITTYNNICMPDE